MDMNDFKLYQLLWGLQLDSVDFQQSKFVEKEDTRHL